MLVLSSSQRWLWLMLGTQSNGFSGFLSESFFLKVIPTVNKQLKKKKKKESHHRTVLLL